MRWVPALALLVLAAAGCSDSPPAGDGDPLVAADSFDDFQLQQTQPQSGVIRGVVVDSSLRPLGGALVELVEQGLNTTTTDAGLFAFKDLAPGLYFLKATLERYETTQTNVDVVADVSEPEVVKVLLQRIAGTEPRAIGGVWDGFIQCSIRIPTAGFVDGCGAFSIAVPTSQRVDLTYEDTSMVWWQGEETWSPSGPTSERLCLGVYETTLAGDDDVCGTSPLVQAMDRTLIELGDLEDGESIDLHTLPDHLANGNSGNLVVQQAFRFVHYVFYNFVPPAGWSFAVDGEPVTPP